MREIHDRRMMESEERNEFGEFISIFLSFSSFDSSIAAFADNILMLSFSPPHTENSRNPKYWHKNPLKRLHWLTWAILWRSPFLLVFNIQLWLFWTYRTSPASCNRAQTGESSFYHRRWRNTFRSWLDIRNLEEVWAFGTTLRWE